LKRNLDSFLRGVNPFQGAKAYKQRFPRIFEEDSLRQRRIGICVANLLEVFPN